MTKTQKVIGVVVVGILSIAAYMPPSSIQQTLNVANSAQINQATITNQLFFPTNAFPLAAGSTWNLTKNYQRIITNNDFVITAIGGLTNNMVNWGMLEWSNSDSATHFCDMSTIPWHPIGASTTNKVYLGAGKVAIISANIPGFASSNLCTSVQP